MCNDFRFLTVFGMTEGVLRCVQNDRGKGCCVRDGREGMLRSGWQEWGFSMLAVRMAAMLAGMLAGMLGWILG